MRNSFVPKLNEARRTLHHRMSRPALAWRHKGLPVDLSQVTVTSVRLFDRFGRIGDLPGQEYAQVLDNTPEIVTLAEQYRPKRGDVITLATRGFRVDSAWPDDEITITAKVIELTPGELTGFPLPVSTGGGVATIPSYV